MRNWFKLVPTFCAVIFTSLVNGEAESFDSCCYINRYKNESILDCVPLFFWNENKLIFEWGYKEGINPRVTKGRYQAKGSAGMVPYVIHRGRIYMLLARESWGADKTTYCDLGGAVEMSTLFSNTPDTFFVTLLKEANEESGGLYEFSRDEVLRNAYVIKYTYENDDCYQGFETVLAFCPVRNFYSHIEFIQASLTHAEKLQYLGLCPWGFQEKDDYQWIDLQSLYEFLEQTSAQEGILKNIYDDYVRIKFRASFLEILRSIEGMDILKIISRELSDF